MTTTNRKTNFPQFVLLSSILIYGSQSIVATPAPQLAKSKKVVVELTIGDLLVDRGIEVPISTSRIGGPLGGGSSFCSHCNEPTTLYFYGMSASRQKNGGAIVHLTLKAAFSDGIAIAIEKDIFVPRKSFVQQSFGDKVKLRAYLEGNVKSL
jgi:hypothetical protein